ncbi:ATP-binding protein [Roseateles sp. MS654]|uniref:ATP-binding protein n=1 Tax=Roseateles sp. MS654 TaxID=3412685 RepID=UPI003C2CA82E
MQQADEFQVEVQPDFIEKITRANPQKALSELIWNALDADARNVHVYCERNELDAPSAVVVRDDGTGIPRAKVQEYFRHLGGSWKRAGARTEGGRFLHGQEGRGRFKAFAIGDRAQWDVVYERDGKKWRYAIAMSAADVKRVRATPEMEVDEATSTGVTLTIAEPRRDFRSFDDGVWLLALGEIFALYLSDYADVSIFVSGHRLDPKAVIAGRKAFSLDDIEVDGAAHPVRLEIVEWQGVSNRALFLCNEHRFPLVQADRRFHIGGPFQFTAYLESSYVGALQTQGLLELSEMQAPMAQSLDQAVARIKDYFRSIAAQEARSYVAEWKAERIYPFSDEAPSTPVELAERQVFDIVAVNVARHLPDFETAAPRSKALHLRMLRQAIEKSPEDLQLILTEVLNLPIRKQEELAELLREGSLSSIINAAKVVADRLKFLAGLEAILFDKGPKQRLKERTQLHRILADNPWIFGEEFHLSVDDMSLTEVLRKHKALLGDDIVIDAPVKHVSQTRGIVDLMLSRQIRRHRINDLTHLVVELKAPTVRIDRDEISQIEGYAASVTADERFRNVDVKWVFWVISDDLGPVGRFKIGENTSTGLIHKTANVSIHIKTWAQVLDDNRARMQFFRERLEFQADKGAALKHLQERYASYLDGIFDATDDEATVASAFSDSIPDAAEAQG